MVSYWERQSFTGYDYIVIGSGIVGLSAAIELKEKHANASVLILERGLLPTGASTRNAGFACMGSLTELLDDLNGSNEASVIALFEERKKGLEKLRGRLGDERIGYKANGSYELINEDELPMLEAMSRMNELLMPVTGIASFRLVNEKIESFGFAKDYTRALVENNCEGEINTGMMMRALINFALSLGVEIKTGADVIRFEETERSVNVIVGDPFRAEQWTLSCDKLLICTNAFTKKLLPGEDVVPGRGQVLITKPVTGLKFKGIYHFDKGYYYFREIDGRVLFGGGRNLDFAGETTEQFELSKIIQNNLEQKLRDIILPDTPFEIDMRWSGIMAFGNNKGPIVKAFSNRVFGAFRMGGMGVALGSRAAEKAAQLIG
ncbi:NAD(P)/FAD-dependent oxidoreductase [Taibaiella soli]|uniref:FAD-binding oxidoreductase n=1 Tax=Taibaiella soli TaxID=1649169 RepID=A0A2W2AMB4_9BACT|nr:FAD-dependent oxidoreductase [Taibaiella soli]PZF73450.1 FAD-binding oxidoreductase [Taibaiella soli]